MKLWSILPKAIKFLCDGSRQPSESKFTLPDTKQQVMNVSVREIDCFVNEEVGRCSTYSIKTDSIHSIL